jgi:DNA polymerase-3 subunit gamma/tau
MYFLKYRPQTIEELDLKEVRQKLSKILQRDQIPHAFLFAGPKGAGKTSAARILAKAINCKQSKDFEPCNQCDSCQAITRGTALDVVEIDAASNRGIDDIRQLKEKIGLAPVNTEYKVYIIDEVHMLTKPAFNALLKTLEEPPAHVVFVLCTTNPEKIIPTVMSRLLRIDFRRGNPREVERSLQKVIEGEDLKVDDKVIKTIVELADGGFRDAQKILESLVLSLGEEISWKQAKPELVHWQKQKPEKVLELLAQGKQKELLKVGEELRADGAEMNDYLQRLLSLVQQLILIKADVDQGEPEARQIAKKFTLPELSRLSRVLTQAMYEQKNAVLPQLPLQLAMIEFLQNNKASASKSESPEQKTRKKAKKKESKKKAETDKKRVKKTKKKAKQTKNKNKKGKISLDLVEEKWNALLKAVKPMNHSVAAFLKAAEPQKVNNDQLILRVFYPFHKDKLEENRNRQIVENGLKQVCHTDVTIKCILAKKKKKKKTKAKKVKEDISEVAEQIFKS